MRLRGGPAQDEEDKVEPQSPEGKKEGPKLFQIFVHTLEGRFVTMEVHDNMRIAELKESIARKTRVRAEGQLLFARGKLLEEETTVKQCGLGKLAKVNLWCRLSGGTARDMEERVMVTLAAINVRKRLMAKLEQLLDMCDEHAIDMLLLSEIGQ